MPEEICDHDYRRVFIRHISPRHAKADEVLCVLCCKCGNSPVRAIRQGDFSVAVNGNWPDEQKITAYYWDDNDGPSVEFRSN